jgi:hypothetical protein
MNIDKDTLLFEAMQYLQDNWDKGVDCPCCHRFVKKYPYKLNSNACLSLIYINNLGENNQDGWVHVQREFKNVYNSNATAMSYIILKHWRFIEPKRNEKDLTKKMSGYWRITDKGKQFIRGNIEVPKTVLVYKDQAKGFAGEMVNIKQALKNKFNYSELMEERYDGFN